MLDQASMLSKVMIDYGKTVGARTAIICGLKQKALEIIRLVYS